MLKKFALWFICFGLSFLVADVFGWTDQGQAFLYIYLGVTVAIILLMIIVLLILGVACKEKMIATGISLLAVIIFMVVTVIALFATWVATKLFEVDFFTTFQIMTFGACLTSLSLKSKDD